MKIQTLPKFVGKPIFYEPSEGVRLVKTLPFDDEMRKRAEYHTDAMMGYNRVRDLLGAVNRVETETNETANRRHSILGIGMCEKLGAEFLYHPSNRPYTDLIINGKFFKVKAVSSLETINKYGLLIHSQELLRSNDGIVLGIVPKHNLKPYFVGWTTACRVRKMHPEKLAWHLDPPDLWDFPSLLDYINAI